MKIKCTKVNNLVLTAVAAMAFTSCQNTELATDVAQTSGNTHAPNTRISLSLLADQGDMSWPVVIYAFDSNNTCAAVQTVSAAATSTEISLPAGTYNIYAVGGLSSDVYDVPSKDDVQSSSALSLKSGVTEHGDIMTAYLNGITLTAGQSDSESLTFARKVAQLGAVSITGVPDAVTGVTVTVTPVYDGINIDGSATGHSATSKTVTLTKSGDTWSYTGGTYLFPQDGETQIKYQFQTGTTTREFVQTTTQFAANHKVSIEATYKELPQTASLSCSLSGAQWAEDVKITCEIDEAQMTTSGGSETTPDQSDDQTGTTEPTADLTSTATAPEVGSKYNSKTDVYVVNVQTFGTTKYVTLMYKWEKSALTNKKATTQAEIKSAAESALTTMNKSGYAGIKKWRLPSIEELQQLNKDYADLQKNFGVFMYETAASIYYCTNGDEVTGYTFSNGTELTPNTQGTGSRINPFVVIKYTNQ